MDEIWYGERPCLSSRLIEQSHDPYSDFECNFSGTPSTPRRDELFVHPRANKDFPPRSRVRAKNLLDFIEKVNFVFGWGWGLFIGAERRMDSLRE